MKILLIGSGGREHALAQKISYSPLCDQLYTMPGNPGTAQYGINIGGVVTDFVHISNFCKEHQINMVVVGSELPLCEGITDYLQEHNPKIIVIGPTAKGAKLEGSKSFAKEFMQRHKIPTAAYFRCTQSNIQEGIEFLKTMSAPYVLKADGLAGGKGVLILEEETEAIGELESMLGGKFGQASTCVVIEEFLSGIEFSVFVLTDGKSYYLLPEAKDYKRVGEGDKGLNTGGMGAISPVPFLNEELLQKVKHQIIEPTVNGLYKDEIDYKGFIFFGLINVNGSPYVIEYNCRMGDPETEVVMPRLESDIVEAFEALKTQSLHLLKADYSPLAAATVILVSGGYPGKFETGKSITGLEDVNDCFVFHAGTHIESDRLVTAGGRVLAITSMGEDFKEAVNNSLANAERINYDGKYYRRDIGFDL
jgi:phosphoribosylamine--glycine ligase